MSEKENLKPIEVPISSLTPDALQSLLEAFILREGTDYGSIELSLEQKVKNLKSKIEKKEIHLIFDPSTETVTFLTRNEWFRYAEK